MEEDIDNILTAKNTFTDTLIRELNPPYSSVSKKDFKDSELPQPLTTKLAIKFLIEGKLKSTVCRYCLNITSGLSELDQVMKIGGTGNVYKVTIRDVVASFHPFKVADDPNFPSKICQKCVDKALGAYLFTQQCERAERALLNCFDDMYEKLEKLDPIDRPKKRGRQKLNPNFNKLHAEHYKVMDYAEPIINIVNVGAEVLSSEPELNDLECKKCCQVLPNLESLMNHEKVHPKTMWYHCRLCGKSFPKLNQLKKHNNKIHVLCKEIALIAEKNYNCNDCSHVTDNFIQHIQHIEKHKFKTSMQLLIEKRMDKLCVVCFSQGMKMMDLDNMVCVHGCHPDLMGDKTIYTLLATTLPHRKSYKYQDLYIPSKAEVMTITKRQNTHDIPKIKNVEFDLTYKFNEMDFSFCSPIVISKYRFKTDHFYSYVFCDPEHEVISNQYIKEIEPLDKNKTKVEDINEMNNKEIVHKLVVDIYEVESDTKGKNEVNGSNKIISDTLNIVDYESNITASDHEKDLQDIEQQHMIEANQVEVVNLSELEIKNNAENEATKAIIGIPDVFTRECNRKDNRDMKMAEANLNQTAFKFSDPKLITDKDALNIDVLNTTPQDIFAKPINQSIKQDNESSEIEKKLRIVSETSAYETPIINLTEKCWIFSSTPDISKSLDIELKSVERKELAKCKFCWVFVHTGFCDQCKMNIKGKSENNKYSKIQELNSGVVSIDKDLGHYEYKIWKCSTCLFVNADRLTCQSCGTTQFTKNRDLEVNFGNNNFFPAKIVTDNVHTNNCSIDPINDSYKNTVEVSIMDFKINSVIEIEPESFNIHTMDIENTAFKPFGEAAADVNDVVAMEVEEIPITKNESFNSTIFGFPAAGTPLQFNIGSTAEHKPLRKFKSYKKCGKGFR